MKALFGTKLPSSLMIFLSCRPCSKGSLTTVCPSLTIFFSLSPCGISLPLFGAGSAIYIWDMMEKNILSSLVCLLKFSFSWLWEKFHMSISQPICLLSIWVVFDLTHSPHRIRIKKVNFDREMKTVVFSLSRTFSKDEVLFPAFTTLLHIYFLFDIKAVTMHISFQSLLFKKNSWMKN